MRAFAPANPSNAVISVEHLGHGYRRRPLSLSLDCSLPHGGLTVRFPPLGSTNFRWLDFANLITLVQSFMAGCFCLWLGWVCHGCLLLWIWELCGIRVGSILTFWRFWSLVRGGSWNDWSAIFGFPRRLVNSDLRSLSMDFQRIGLLPLLSTIGGGLVVGWLD